MTLDQIRTLTYLYTSTNSTSLPDATLVPLANTAMDRVTSLIMQSDARWQWDDSNNTDLPIATTALVANQQDYKLSTAHLDIERMEVMDTSSTWHKLLAIDQADVYDQSLSSFQNAAGLPVYYDKVGSSVFLYPSPNYAQAASLKIYFQRGPNYFLTSDTTKEPGFNALYHDLIPLWIAYNFAIANGKENGKDLFAEIQQKENALQEDYALRSKDDHNRLKARPQRWN